jgi:hypothetical protein
MKFESAPQPRLLPTIRKQPHQNTTSLLQYNAKMLPPIEDSVLQSNPKFAALHATLANSILNPNGSTKNHHAQKELDAVTEVQPLRPLFYLF